MKTALKILGALSLIAWGLSFGHAAQVCQRTDFFCYESGPSQNLTTPARLDANGNLTLLGAETVTGANTAIGQTIYSPGSAVGLTTQSTISPTATYMLLTSTGGTVTLGQGAPYVAIATASAVNGQIIILGSTVAANGAVVSLTSGTASGLDLGAATRTISYGKKLGLIFDSLTSMWTELFYGNN